MKKLIPFLMLLAGAVGALAQDGKIDFANQRTYATVADRNVRDSDGVTLLVGTNYAAQLMYGRQSDSLTAHTGISFFRASALPGTWTGATRTLTGIPYNTPGVFVQVRVWDYNAGTTFDAAQAAGGKWGQSAIFTFDVPASTAPVSAFYMENLRGFSLVPEPSIIGLSLIGAGALLFLRRRK
jgi:hypothetical protein